MFVAIVRGWEWRSCIQRRWPLACTVAVADQLTGPQSPRRQTMKHSYLGRSAAKWLGCGVLAISAAACASDKTPAKEPVAMGEMTAPGPQSPQGSREGDTTIAISEDFRRECNLPNAPKDAPHFAYADATLHAHGANILDDVAKCLSEGALKGRVMTIIGRTDARGSAAYNKELSANRAEAARNYLVQRGVAAG